MNHSVAQLSDQRDHQDPALVLLAKLENQLKEFQRELDELKREVQANG